MADETEKNIIDILNNIEFYHVILIKMTENFKQHLQDTYKKNNQWKWILNIIKLMNQTHQNQSFHNKNTTEQSSELYFTYWNGLIYYINDVNECKCLYISSQFKKKIFKLIYDYQHYKKFH